MTTAALLLSPVAVTIGSPPSSPGPGEAAEIVVEFVDSEAHVFTEEERRVLLGIAEDAVAAQLAGTPDEIVLVVQAGAQVIPETGEGGTALAPRRIGWTVDPRRPAGVLAIARIRLRSTLFHEVHHLVRGWTIEGGTAGGWLIDAAASEGLATAFERDAAG